MEKLSVADASAISPISLAFVGDAAFSLYVRERLTRTHDFKSGELSRLTSLYVNAAAQSKMLLHIMPLLTEEEAAVAKRARNAYTGSKAKNATIGDYHRATGLEGLFGWLYLSGQADRLDELQGVCFDFGASIIRQ